MTDRSDNGGRLAQELQELLGDADDNAISAFFAELHAADVADCLEAIEPENRSRIMFLLPPRKWAEAIALLDEAVRSDVLDEMTDDQVSEVLKELPADDVVDVLDELDAEVADRVVEQMQPEQKAIVEPLRQYDEDTAGGLMNPDYVSIPADGTVEDAVSEIRHLTPRKLNEAFYIYSVDSDGRLQGVVSPMRLLTAPPQARVRNLLLKDVFTAYAGDDQEEVKNKFEKYDVAALPVVDDNSHMLGIITHDDVLDVAEEEAEEDMFRMAGTAAEEFAKAGIFHAASVRARWLLPCLAGTFVGVFIILLFKRGVSAEVFTVVLAFLTPIAAMGGNAGVQISTVIVRGMATNDAIAACLKTAVNRELRIAVIIGLGAGLFAGFGAFALVHSGVLLDDMGQRITAEHLPLARVAAAVGTSMTLAILISGSLAMTLPYLFRRLGIDPAIATGPLITTSNDILSAAIYLSIALALIP
ncbi:MAG: magnesium transporter [Planctomycetota bacterium]